MTEELPDLPKALDGLRQLMRMYRGHSGHLVPDIVLYNLALDVLERVEATILLTASPTRFLEPRSRGSTSLRLVH